MSDFGAVTVAALGAVTQPTSVVLGTPAAVSLPTGSDFARWGEYQAIPLPQANAVIFTHGTEAMRYAREGASLRLGLLAPDDGFTAASTGVKAHSTLTLGAGAGTLPNNDDSFNLGVNIALFKIVYWKTTLDTTATTNQVKIGATVAACLSNLKAMVDGTGTQGVEFFDGWQAFSVGYYDADYWHTAHQVEGSTLTATTLKVQATYSGTAGNALRAEEVTDTAATQVWTGTTLASGAAGTGSEPAAGEHDYKLAHLRSGDNALSAATPTLVTVDQDGNYNISLASAAAFVTRDATDYNRWLRTMVGAVQLFKVKDTTATSATDDISDDTLGNKLFRYQYRDEIQRPRISGYPVVHAYGTMWRGRLWTIGAKKWANYTKGTVAVTVGSATVTFSSTAHVKEDWIGRHLRISATTIDYLIIDVDASANTAKLGRAYVDATDATAVYALMDLRSGTDADFSEPEALNTSVNNWPVGNNLGGVQAKTLYGATGASVDARGNLVLFTLTGVWRVTGSPGSFAIQNIGEGMGCFSGPSIQVAGGILYWLGPDGVWSWSGEGDPICLSKPRADESSGIQGTIDAINGDEATIICGNYNPSSHRIRWWIPVDGSVSNNRCLRLNLQSGQFALHTAKDITCAWTMPGPAGTQVTLTGDLEGHIDQIDCGYIDGAYGFEPKQTFSSYVVATRTYTVTGTALPTSGDGLSGIPVVLLRPSTGAYEMAKVASNTSSAVVFTSPIAMTPAAGDLMIVGGIPLDCLSGKIHDNHPEMPKWLEAMSLGHEVESAATEVWVGACADNDDPSIFPIGDYCDMTESDGEHHHWLRTARGRSIQFRLVAFGRGHRVRLRGYALKMRSMEWEEVFE